MIAYETIAKPVSPSFSMQQQFSIVVASLLLFHAFPGLALGQESCHECDYVWQNIGPPVYPDCGCAKPPPLEFNACQTGCYRSGMLSELSRRSTYFLGINGSKQPQDFGVNANLGIRGSLNYGAPILPDAGIGIQAGGAVTTHGNAVQVFELLGVSSGSTQGYATAGIFQRQANGFAWGAVYDYLYEETFDNFNLGQWRFKVEWPVNQCTDMGMTFNFAAQSDTGRFNNESVALEPIEQLHLYVRKFWESGASTTFWIGVADGHSEENAVTGTLPRKSNQILYGADLRAPLNNWLAIYGETNLMMPADTGAVDAFLGIQFSPRGNMYNVRSNRYRPLFSVAGNPTFTVDLNRQP